MNRRGFLKSILAAGVAPAFVGASVLMPVRKLWTPDTDVLTLDKLKRVVEQMKAAPTVDDLYYIFGGSRIWTYGRDGIIEVKAVQIR